MPLSLAATNGPNGVLVWSVAGPNGILTYTQDDDSAKLRLAGMQKRVAALAPPSPRPGSPRSVDVHLRNTPDCNESAVLRTATTWTLIVAQWLCDRMAGRRA